MKYYCVAIGDYEEIVDITLQKFMKSSSPHSPSFASKLELQKQMLIWTAVYRFS